jgi:hypothetical protein
MGLSLLPQTTQDVFQLTQKFLQAGFYSARVQGRHAHACCGHVKRLKSLFYGSQSQKTM